MDLFNVEKELLCEILISDLPKLERQATILDMHIENKQNDLELLKTELLDDMLEKQKLQSKIDVINKILKEGK